MGFLDFRNWTVRGSLRACGFLVIAGNLILLAAYLWSNSIETNVQEQVGRVTDIKLTAKDIQDGVLKARRIEKEFLLERKEESTNQHAQTINDTFAQVDRFKELAKGDAELERIAARLDESIPDYTAGFADVFTLQQKLGLTPEQGLQGTMRNAIRDVEAKLAEANQARLQNAVLQMRRYEKDFLLRRDKKSVDSFKALADEFSMNLDISGLDEEMTATLKKGFELYNATFNDMTATQFEMDEVARKMQADADAIDPVLAEMIDAADARQKQIQEQADSDRSLAKTIVIGVLVAVAALLVLAFVVIMRRIGPPLAAAASACAEIADGDLRRTIAVERRDEIGDLLSSLSAMSAKLREVVGDVRLRTHSINTSATEISSGNTDLSQRTEQQAANLEETASSMEEMTSTVKQNSDNARQANQLANAAREQAEKGGQVVSGAVRAMGEISTASKKIADIIGVVDEIAFQTNLLALNAAVEAARAGEQGRGFAVVATEVRNLAQRSAQAAKEIKDLISDSVEKVSAGSKLVDQTGTTLSELVIAVKKVSDIVSEIAAASLEQSEGIDQVNKAVMHMDEMTQQNAALVEEAAASAKALEDQADAMAQAVAFFRLGDERGGPVPARAAEPRVLEVDLTQQRAARAAPTPAPRATPPAPRAAAPRAAEIPRAQPAPQAAAAGAADDSEWEEF